MWIQKKIKLIYIIIIIIIITGIFFIKIDDNIKHLQSPSKNLIKHNNFIKKIIGENYSSQYFIIEKPTIEETLIATETLIEKLKMEIASNTIESFRSVTPFLLSKKKQKENIRQYKSLIKKNSNKLRDYILSIGLTEETYLNFKKDILNSKYSINVNDWKKLSFMKDLKMFWLGKTAYGYRNIVTIHGIKNEPVLINIAKQDNGISYINMVSSYSKTFRKLRIKSIYLLIFAYIIIFIILSLKYSLKNSYLVFLPPIFASLLTIVILNILGYSLNLFAVLALILVLGMGIDYSIFFAESKLLSATLLAVIISSLTTICSFGLLSLSTTIAVSSFGIYVLVGIFISFILSLTVPGTLK